MSSMPRARGARVFRSSRWAPPPLLAALLLDVAIGQAAGISLSKRFHPTRNAFGPNCTFPETSTCHTADKSSTAAAAGVAVGSSLDQLMGMYARHPRTAAWWRTNVLDAARRPLRLLHSWRAHLLPPPPLVLSLVLSRHAGMRRGTNVPCRSGRREATASWRWRASSIQTRAGRKATRSAGSRTRPVLRAGSHVIQGAAFTNSPRLSRATTRSA
jgi:hypothetical protein